MKGGEAWKSNTEWRNLQGRCEGLRMLGRTQRSRNETFEAKKRTGDRLEAFKFVAQIFGPEKERDCLKVHAMLRLIVLRSEMVPFIS